MDLQRSPPAIIILILDLEPAPGRFSFRQAPWGQFAELCGARSESWRDI